MTWQVWLVLAIVLVVVLKLRSDARRKRLLASLGDPTAFRAGTRDVASDGHREVLRTIKQFDVEANRSGLRNRLSGLRRAMDNFGGSRGRDGASMGVEVRPVDVNDVAAEWILAPDSDPDRRLLYIHGGAYFVGSPLSHRPLTAALAKRTRSSVLAIDYRLMPEHPRLRGILDCQDAYRWILEHGPNGDGPPRRVYAAGDSAGGNLTLMLVAWIRDQGLRQLDGAVALSPATEAVGESPSLRMHARTDPMLGPVLGKMMKLPLAFLGIVTRLIMRIAPKNPLISPLRGDLSNLPPTLVHASEMEMLFDDARRYVRKAREAGSPVTLQTWPGMVHVWQIFDDILPEAREALDHIEAFLAECERE